MRATGARLLVDCLLAQGVTTAFGVPGESYLAVLDALHDVADRIRLVPNRQEGGAAFMAAAWGKLTGAPGVAFVTRGPGATNAAIGVHTARQDSAPMVVFVGQVARRCADARPSRSSTTAPPSARWRNGRPRSTTPTGFPRSSRAPSRRRSRGGRAGGRRAARGHAGGGRPTARAGPALRVPRPAPAAAELEAIALTARRGGAAADRSSAAAAGARPVARAPRPSPRRPPCRCSPISAARTFSTTPAPPMPATRGSARRRASGRCSPRPTSSSRSARSRRDHHRRLRALRLPRMAARLIHVHADAGRAEQGLRRGPAGARRSRPADAGARRERASPPRPARSERLAAARAAWRASLDTPPQPGGLDMGAVMATCRRCCRTTRS